MLPPVAGSVGVISVGSADMVGAKVAEGEAGVGVVVSSALPVASPSTLSPLLVTVNSLKTVFAED